MIAGVIGGCFCGMATWLSYAAQFEGGLAPSFFVKNTGREYPMLAGNITAIFVGALLAIVVSLITRRSMTPEEVEAEWEKTRDIDNPLSPWVQVYKVGKNPGTCLRPVLTETVPSFLGRVKLGRR